MGTALADVCAAEWQAGKMHGIFQGFLATGWQALIATAAGTALQHHPMQRTPKSESQGVEAAAVLELAPSYEMGSVGCVRTSFVQSSTCGSNFVALCTLPCGLHGTHSRSSSLDRSVQVTLL
jgi:hypothetical protein